jgi:hypothetical protein
VQNWYRVEGPYYGVERPYITVYDDLYMKSTVLNKAFHMGM